MPCMIQTWMLVPALLALAPTRWEYSLTSQPVDLIIPGATSQASVPGFYAEMVQRS